MSGIGQVETDARGRARLTTWCRCGRTITREVATLGDIRVLLDRGSLCAGCHEAACR